MSEKLRSFFSAHGQTILTALLLFGATLWLFWPSVGYELINFDDDRYIVGNEPVRLGLSLQGIAWAFKFIYQSYWLPMIWLSYMLDTTLFGFKASSYHFTNVLLHAINAGLLFVFLKTWTKRFWLSLFVAALFAWHPLRVESVAWISERKDVLSAFFLILCLMSYGKFTRKPVAGREVRAALFLTLGLMTKPILVVVPFLLLLLDVWPFGRWDAANRPAGESFFRLAWKRISEKVLFWALMLVFIFLTLHTQSAGNAVHSTAKYSIGERLLSVPEAYLFYLKKTVLPTHLAMIYRDLPISLPHVSLALLILGLITIAALWAGKRSKAVPVGWIWFGLLLGPVIGLIRVGTVQVADRFTYLPSIGLGICVAWFVSDIAARQKSARMVTAALAILVLLGCAWQTRQVLPHWKNPDAAFENVLKYYPEHGIANNNYASSLLTIGKIEEALEHYKIAIAAEPDQRPYKANAAMALIFMGKADEAIQQMEELTAQSGPNPFSDFALGTAYVSLRQFDKGIPLLELSSASPARRETWNVELAGAYLMAGDEATAQKQFEHLARTGWSAYASRTGLFNFYSSVWLNGNRLHAWSFFSQIAGIYSNDAALINNVAWLLATMPPKGVPSSEAVRLAERAHELMGDRTPINIMDTLGVAYASNGDFTNALYWVNKAYNLCVANGAMEYAAKLDKRRQAFNEGRPWTENVRPQ